MTEELATRWQQNWHDLPRTPGAALWDSPSPVDTADHIALFERHIDPTLPLLDVGCGNGTQTVCLGYRFPRVIGLDVVEAATARARTARPAQVPPSLGATDLSPAISWSTSSLRVPEETVPFPDDRPRRAAVSSFGLSGANVHMLLSAPPAQPDARDRLPRRTWNTQRYWYTELLGVGGNQATP
jgi:SAM-dependent methyltransferase